MSGLDNIRPCRHSSNVRIGPALLVAMLCALVGCTGRGVRRDSDALLHAQALALLQTINADLLSHPSATLTLERWCADHRLADPARVVVRHLHGAIKPLPPDLRRKLEIDADTPVGYRHVQLVCGREVLSEAENWYVPSRLTVAMNRQLETSDTPFGKVVRSLHFQRRTLSVRLLWSPLPAAWEMSNRRRAGAGRLRIPHYVLRHEAVLYTDKQVPFSAVVETYTNGLFDFGEWARYRN